MPRNPAGTPEIRALFSAVDALSVDGIENLVSPDGATLTPAGHSVARSYENWRQRGLVPDVYYRHPALSEDAPYVAEFLKLVKGGWRANHECVRHLYASAIWCPPKVIRNALSTIIPVVERADPSDPDAINIDQLASQLEQVLDDIGRGNSKDYRETSDGHIARLLGNVMKSGKGDPGELAEYVAPDARGSIEGPTLHENLKIISGWLISTLLADPSGGMDANLSMFGEDDSHYLGPDFDSLLKKFGFDTSDITIEERRQNVEDLRSFIRRLGAATTRLRGNPESLYPQIHTMRSLARVAFRVIPALKGLFGPANAEFTPKQHAQIDTLIIYFAALSAERPK